MDSKKAKIWSLIAQISYYSCIGIVLITVLGGSFIWHVRPGSLGNVIPMGIAAGLLFLGVGIKAVLASVPASQKEHQLREENLSE